MLMGREMAGDVPQSLEDWTLSGKTPAEVHVMGMTGLVVSVVFQA